MLVFSSERPQNSPGTKENQSTIKTLALTLTALGVAQVLLSAQYPIINNQPASRAVWAGGNVTLAVGVSNAGEFSYQWQLNTTNLPSAIITTVAGNGKMNYSGDGGAATNASLSCFSVAVDGSGNLFVADGNNNRIRKVDTNGVITTLAGSGTPGHLGDGGAATNANLYQPTGVVVDGSGNLFIADHFHYLIRKVGTNGIITTVAGNGGGGYSGDGGAATNASLYQPFGVAVDALGNLFIADDDNSRIRKVGTNGIITTVAGNGTLSYCGDGGAATNACLNWPAGVTVDAFGNLFIADEFNNRVRKVDTNGIITTVAGGGHNGLGDGDAATNASLDLPYGVAVDASGNLLIADSINHRIRKVDTNGIITTVAGGGLSGLGDGSAATSAALWLPDGVAADASGNLFIADEGANRIRKVTNTQQGRLCR